MSIKNDNWFRERGKEIFDPFTPHQTKEDNGRKVISYGVSSYGYDVRLANEFSRVCPVYENSRDTETHIGRLVIDPKGSPLTYFKTNEPLVIWPNEFVLGRTVERVKVPRECLVVCLGKSTYARCGLIVNVTPLEPEWEGYVTLEISNTGLHPCLVYPNEGIAQFIFHEAAEVCDVSYADKGGKYQNQTSVVGPKV